MTRAMSRTEALPGATSPVGAMLRYWRETRSLSQLALALEAEVSPRHVCFVETGRSKPSRKMILHLAATLEVPLRERNTLLLAAGYAPMYAESSLDEDEPTPEMVEIRKALAALLEQQEPYPAVVMNRRWDLLDTNAAASRFFGYLLGAQEEEGSDTANVLRLMFDPQGLRPWVENWTEVGEALLRRVTREAVGGVPDDATRELVEELLAYPGVPLRWRRPSLEEPLVPVIPVRFAKDGRTFNFFSTVTVLGTPQDVTLQEIRIECFFPYDEATRHHVEELASESP